MRRFEVGDAVFVFVDLDNDEARDEGGEAKVICCGVDVGACLLLLRCVGWLKD